MSIFSDSLKKMLNKYSLDIRFWILFFFIIRLYGISFPPLEFEESWRQTTVCMVARNFLEIDANICYPRLDIAGEKSGITGMEFPILNYLIYLSSKIFGYAHWYGRLINLFISSIGIWYFYKLIQKYFSLEIAKYASFILLCSIWFSYSRKIMPDTFSMSFIIAALYYGSNYFDRSTKSINLILYMLLASIGILSKLPSAYLLSVLILFILNDTYSFKSKFKFILSNVLLILFPAFWYFYWVPHLVQTYSFWHFFMGNPISTGFKEIVNELNLSLNKFYFVSIKYVGFCFFIFGVINMIYYKNKLLISIFLITFSSFSIIIFKAGWTFAHHDHYIIPFTPIMALVSGYGISLVSYKNSFIIILILISFEGILNQKKDFKIYNHFRKLSNLESDLDQFSNINDRIMINSGLFPTPMYFAHRKGWVETNEKILDKDYMRAAIGLGLKYVVILKRALGTEIKLDYPCVFNNDDYAIYKVSNPISGKSN